MFTERQKIATNNNLIKGRGRYRLGLKLSDEWKKNISMGGKGKHKAWKKNKPIRKKRKDGYIDLLSPFHPKARNGYIFEHLLIWEKSYNKKLPDGYIIHHLNGIKDDNRPENLIAMGKAEHLHQAEPYKKRIRELEAEIFRLKQLNLFPIH